MRSCRVKHAVLPFLQAEKVEVDNTRKFLNARIDTLTSQASMRHEELKTLQSKLTQERAESCRLQCALSAVSWRYEVSRGCRLSAVGKSLLFLRVKFCLASMHVTYISFVEVVYDLSRDLNLLMTGQGPDHILT